MKKYILTLAIFLVLVLASFIFLPYLFKDQIIDFVKKEANEKLKAEMTFDNNIRINIFKSFPNLNVGLNNLCISDSSGKFTNDTFFYAEEINVSFDLKEWYKNERFLLKEVDVQSPMLHAEVNEKDESSWDIFKPSEASNDESEITLELEEIIVNAGSFVYIDQVSSTVTRLKNINHVSDGNLKDNVLTLNSKTEANDFNVGYQGISYVNRWDIQQAGDIVLDLNTNTYSFNKNEVGVNGLPLEVNGTTALSDDNINFNLSANSTSKDIRKFLTLIPAIYSSDYLDMDAKGSGELAFEFKGDYNDKSFPAYDLKLDLKNGEFKYPELNYPAEDLNMDLHVYSLDGNTDKTVVNIPDVHFMVNRNPFDAKLNVQDLFGDPLIDASAVGMIDLSDFKQLVPLPEGTSAEGEIYTDIEINGRISAISQSDINGFRSKGRLETNQLVYQTSDMQEQLIIDEAKIDLDNKGVAIPIASGKLGNNDVEFSGTLYNFFSYILQNETLVGKIKMYSNKLNLNDFTEEGSGEESEMTLIELPGNVDLDLSAEVDDLTYDDLLLSDVRGNVQVKDKTMALKNVSSQLLGGRIKLDGNYQYNPSKPRAAFDISYSNIKISELMKNFNVFKAFAPLAAQVEANTTAKLSFASDLNQDMSPILSNINLGGSINLEKIAIEKLSTLQQLDSKLGTNHFNIKKLNDFLLRFNIKEGKLFVDPFNLFIDSSKLSLSGISKVDGSIDYKGFLSLPATYVKNEAKFVSNLTKGTAFEKYGFKSTDFLDIAVSLIGSYKNPQLKLNVKEIRDNLKQSVKNTVRQEIDKKKEAAEKQVKAETERIKEETQKKAEEAKQKIKEDLEQKKAEAVERLKQEAEERKKKLREEAGKRFRDILNNAKGGG